MKKLIIWLESAFNSSSTGGSSARRLSAFWMVMLVTVLELTYTVKCFIKERELSYLPEMIYSDLAFAATALGMTLYKGKKEETPVTQAEDVK